MANKRPTDMRTTLLTEQEKSQLERGLENLGTLPQTPLTIPGKHFSTAGLVGFRRREMELKVTVACERAQVRHLELAKFCALVEYADDPTMATVMLDNFKPLEKDGGRGQTLACLNLKHSALEVVQGLSGKIIRDTGDIALYDVYYLPRELLEVYYRAARYQIGTEDDLDDLINRFDGWREFDLPMHLIRPTLVVPDESK